MKAVKMLATLLLIIGGLNWGLVGLMDLDLVAKFLGAGTTAAKAVYVLVGLSALLKVLGLSKCASSNEKCCR